jgi:hypothetical protein
MAREGMTRALVLQHIRCEPPGLSSAMLNGRGVAIETIELDEGGELPDWRDGDPVLGVLGEEFPALQWHGDTFGIPAGAVHLARSTAYHHQAFRFGEAAYAVQFHVEVTGGMLAEWGHVPAYRRSAEAVLGSSGFEILAAGFAAAEKSMARSASLMFAGWLDQAGRAAARRGSGARL